MAIEHKHRVIRFARRYPLKRERRPHEGHPNEILVSFREHVRHECLSPEVSASASGAGIAMMRDVNGKGRRMGKIAFGEYGHAVLADVDGAYLLIKVYPARVCALNPNG